MRILILATGLASRGPATRDDIAALRRDGVRAAEILGAEDIMFSDFPDNAMDGVPLLDVVKRIETFLGDFPADVIYTHHLGDLNVDHRQTHMAVLTARRLLPGMRPVEILAGEVLSSTEWAAPGSPAFVPTDFLDIAASLERKVAAMEAYASELGTFPHPRSADGIRALARMRGAQCGRPVAEAFMTVRRLRTL